MAGSSSSTPTIGSEGNRSDRASVMASTATALVFLLLITGNSITAARRSRGDAAATTFIAASYASLVLLFYCLRRFEAAAPGSADKDRAKAGVWLTTALLTAMFAWRVAALMPWAVGLGVWFIAAATVLGGFYTLFILPRGGD